MTIHALKVLVLCTGNSCRSQMAEGFLRSLGGDRVEVQSAGLAPTGLNPRAVAVMAEAGIDISDHTSKPLDGFLDREFDFVVTVCNNAAANCPVFRGDGTRLHWPFDDPAGFRGSDEEIMAGFRRVRDEIRARVEKWLKTPAWPVGGRRRRLPHCPTSPFDSAQGDVVGKLGVTLKVHVGPASLRCCHARSA